MLKSGSAAFIGKSVENAWLLYPGGRNAEGKISARVLSDIVNFTTTPTPANPTDALASTVGPASANSTVAPFSGDAPASTMDIPVLDAAACQVSHAARLSQHKLDLTIGTLFLHHSPDNVLLITSTFPKEVSRKDAMHRFGKLLRKIRKVGSEYLWVFERGYGGHIHFHLLLVVPFDTRKGVNLDAYGSIVRNRLSAKRKLVNKPTAELWDKVDQWCRDFGIGRTEVAPLYKPPGAIRNYLRKSVAHNWCYRKVAAMPDGDSDKGVSWWRCSHGLATVFGNFSFVCSPFREAVRLFAEQNGWEDLEELKENLGRSWTWIIREFKESMGMEYIRSLLLSSRRRGGATTGATTSMDAPEAILSDPGPAAGSMSPEKGHHAASVIRSVDRRAGPGRRDPEQEARAEPELMRGARSPQGTRQRGREHESAPKRRSLRSWPGVWGGVGFG